MHTNLTEEAYIVESIVGHYFPKDGEIRLTIKWMGYEELSDEPLSSMYDQIKDTVIEYFAHKNLQVNTKTRPFTLVKLRSPPKKSSPV